ncbi:hypothetical protein B7P43_G16797 [Cryptotermes secundus]|uniref:Uncharacterized protein n=1 Tax=Cryptotermes secundus TaxID=105785 RepID=A0A2J7PKI6_9NEOP|nr:hypothetical protein B7P43_G16797 [Cryptotermes secundus]
MQKWLRYDATRNHSERCKHEGEAFLCRVITLDETWAKSHESQMKLQPNEWRHYGSPRKSKVRQNPSNIKVMNYGDQNQFLKFASLFIGSIFLIAGYCWFGQQVIDESEKVQLAFYSTEWYSQTAGYKSLLPLAIMRASRPVTVKAGVFFDMSFLTLASVGGLVCRELC